MTYLKLITHTDALRRSRSRSRRRRRRRRRERGEWREEEERVEGGSGGSGGGGGGGGDSTPVDSTTPLPLGELVLHGRRHGVLRVALLELRRQRVGTLHVGDVVALHLLTVARLHADLLAGVQGLTLVHFSSSA
jgi:hypothetical protein